MKNIFVVFVAFIYSSSVILSQSEEFGWMNSEIFLSQQICMKMKKYTIAQNLMVLGGLPIIQALLLAFVSHKITMKDGTQIFIHQG